MTASAPQRRERDIQPSWYRAHEFDLARLEKYISPEPNTGCWLWIGSQTRRYGNLTRFRRPLKAHRFVYELTVGPIPQGL